MDADKASIGAGDVKFTLLHAQGDGADEMTLKPSYNAARTLSNQAGGLIGVLDRIARLDVAMTEQVIALGLGYGGQRRAPQDLAERIWRTGLSDDTGGLAERCIMYIRILMGGGRPPVEKKEGGDPLAG